MDTSNLLQLQLQVNQVKCTIYGELNLILKTIWKIILLIKDYLTVFESQGS